ncbi:hypothetical protein GCM10018952_34900 [Streptosporangium vulgare]
MNRWPVYASWTAPFTVSPHLRVENRVLAAGEPSVADVAVPTPAFYNGSCGVLP